MSELRSVVAQLQAEVLTELSDAMIEQDFGELHRAVELLEVERLRRLAEIERRKLHERDGHLSAAGWLSSRFGVPWGPAHGTVRVARALEAMPLTTMALREGEVPLSSARVLAQARDAEPEAFAHSEASLLRAARERSPAEVRAIATWWRHGIERERQTSAEERLHERRRLDTPVGPDGGVHLDGDLDLEGGETVLVALRAVQDADARAPAARSDTRTPSQRRADALVEICRQWLDLDERPRLGGERPHVNLTISAEALRAAGLTPGTTDRTATRRLRTGDVGATTDVAATGPGELDHVGPVPAEAVRRLTCDAALMRVVLSARSEPLDVGRRTHVVPPSMRRAVIVRDRTCRFPGCDRPHTWCDAHHVVHWADGGATSLANLVLLCRPHHRSIHRPRGFTLERGPDGAPVFRRPDGSVLADRSPP